MKLISKVILSVLLLSACQPSDKKIRPDKPKADVQKPAEEKAPEKNPPVSEEAGNTPTPPPAPVPVPLPVPVPPSPQAPAQVSPNAPKENVDFVFLEPKDLQEIGAVAFSYFGQDLDSALTPYSAIKDHAPFKSASFNGQLDKAQFKIEFEGAEPLEFNNVKIKLNKEGRGGNGEYGLLAMCVGADCAIIIATVSIRIDGQYAYNLPLFFKRVAPGKYLEAYRKKGQETPTEELPQSEAPPQLKVANQLTTLVLENSEQMIKLIKTRMRELNAVYSSMFFSRLSKGTVPTEFEKKGDELHFQVTATFLPTRQKFLNPVTNKQDTADVYDKVDLNFEGTMKDKEVSVYQATAETNLSVIPLKGTDLFLLLYDKKNFEALLPGENRGMSAQACSVLVENGTTYHECYLISSSEIAGTMALESKADGPIYIKDGVIVDKVPPPEKNNNDSGNSLKSVISNALKSAK